MSRRVKILICVIIICKYHYKDFARIRNSISYKGYQYIREGISIIYNNPGTIVELPRSYILN